MKALVEHTLFEGFQIRQLERILEFSSHRQLATGEVLIEVGANNSTLFVLYEGELHIIVEDLGTNLVLPVKAGECIGEMSLILDRPTSAYAVAQKPSKLLLMPEGIFWEEFANTRQGVRNLMSIMTKRLRRNNLALIQKMEEQLHFKNLQKEMEAAGKIQTNMIPDPARLLAKYIQVDVHAVLKQTFEVGGDFYDALALDDEHIYFAIGDASGKGMSAALFMIRAMTAMRMTVMNSPFEQVLPRVNEILMRNNEETMFVSLFGGILNVKNGHLRYVNAGHNPTVAALGGRAFELLPMPLGSVLGVTTENVFTVAEIQLENGDILLLYTDGVTEASRGDEVIFEESRLLEALSQADRSSMKELVTSLEESVTQFISGAPQYDDITILGLKYVGH